MISPVSPGNYGPSIANYSGPLFGPYARLRVPQIWPIFIHPGGVEMAPPSLSRDWGPKRGSPGAAVERPFPPLCRPGIADQPSTIDGSLFSDPNRD